MIDKELEEYINKYVRLNKKVFTTIEYIDIVIDKLKDNPEYEDIITILRIIKASLYEI